MRRAGLAAALAVVATLGAAALSADALGDDAPGLDLSSIAARADAAVADPNLAASLRPEYRKLARALAKRDRPGIADEFAKLERTAGAIEGPLAGDGALVAAVRDVLAQGLADALPEEDLAVARIGALVETTGPRRAVDANLRSARLTLEAALSARDVGRTDVACRLARRAAVRYTDARRVAEGTVRKQDRRAARWQVVLENRPGSLLSVHVGRGLTPDVFVVGAADGEGPQFLRGGGEAWVRIPVGDRGDLWWVDEVPGAGIWACGTEGRVVRYDPATGAVTDVSTGALGATSTLYGIWGSGPDDVWTVGDGSTDGNTVLHWDGAAWAVATLPPEAGRREVYKLWGSAADDVWACGNGGLLLHWDGAAWTAVPSGTATALLTVHGSGSRVTAVGQVIGTAITERQPSGAFAPVAVPPSVPSVAGVFVPPSGAAWAVGYIGTVLRRTARGWRAVTDVPGTQGRDLHSVAIDDAGGVWIAGGDIVPSRDDGVLLYYGARTPSNDVVRRASFRSRVQPTLSANCVDFGCHGGVAPAHFATSTAESSLEGLVGRPSVQSRLLRVLPGWPSRSYLVHKLEGTFGDVGGFGETMPQGREPLQSADLEAVRAWILEGALDSE